MSTGFSWLAAMAQREHNLVSGTTRVENEVPIGPFSPGTDLGWMVKSQTSAIASVVTEGVIVKDN